MIPVFICHICDTAENCGLAIKITDKLRRDIKNIEVFVACQDKRWGGDAKKLNIILSHCCFFVPIISKQFPDKSNCCAELTQARKRQTHNTKFPIILPIKYHCDSELMKKLGFAIDQVNETGELWEDFYQDEKFESNYQKLCRRIYYAISDNGLTGNEDFVKDCKILDIILKEKAPTSTHIKIAIDCCYKAPEYGIYFFRKLNNPDWLKHLDASGFFDTNPSPIESENNTIGIPAWPVLFYMENISQNAPKEIARIILDIMKRISKPTPPAKKQDNTKTWYYFTRIIANLPLDVIEVTDIDLVADWLDSKFDTSLIIDAIDESLLPKLLSAEDAHVKAERLTEIIIDAIKIDKDSGLKMHHVKELFEHNAVTLGERCGLKVIETLQKKLETDEIISKEDDNFSYIWRLAIEDHTQNSGDYEMRHILIKALRDVLLSYASKKDASAVLGALMQSNKNIVKRIALYALTQQFGKYNSQIETVTRPVLRELLLNINCRHECYNLFRVHFAGFSMEFQAEIINQISSLEGNWRDGVNKAKWNMHIRGEWFNAIALSGYSLAQEIRDEYLKDFKDEHPKFPVYSEGTAGWGDEQVFSPAELLSKGTAEDIVKFLNAFDGKNSLGELALREAGLSLKDAVKAKQELFETNLDSFARCKWEYWLYLLEAFTDIWQEGKPIQWDRILDFIEVLIKADSELWKKQEIRAYPLTDRKEWVISRIARLIESGISKDARSMPQDCYVKAEAILKTLLNKQESLPDKDFDENDANTRAINSPKGHVIEAFIKYALHRCRTIDRIFGKESQEKEAFWKTVEPVFNAELQKTRAGNFEFSTLCGSYLPNFYYMNKDWVENNINKILPAEIERLKNWKSAMQGYSYVSTVYTVIYNLLKENGDFRRVLDGEFDNPLVVKKTVENIAVSYLREQESLNDSASLFNYFLAKWDLKYLTAVIDIFWGYRNDINMSPYKMRICDFWRACMENINGHENENTKLLSDLNLLAVFLDEIDAEKKQWLIKTAPYVGEEFHSSFFLEYLDKLADRNPKEVGEIFLVMLEKLVPDFREENIKSIVEKIYKADEKHLANQICDKYARKQYGFLIELYNKYDSSD